MRAEVELIVKRQFVIITYEENPADKLSTIEKTTHEKRNIDLNE